MSDISAAMARDATRESVRFFAAPEDLYAWLCDQGKAFVEENFAGRLSDPYSTSETKRLAAFTVEGGTRVGSLSFRYRVEPAGSIADREAVDLFVDAVWSKPRFFADSSKAGVAINDARWGVWNRAAQQFEKVSE